MFRRTVGAFPRPRNLNSEYGRGGSGDDARSRVRVDGKYFQLNGHRWDLRGLTALGQEVIFVVGQPRSGSTLFEQVLAAHPEVEGASELPDLGIVLQRESVRRGTPYPQWVPHATAADWHRLGNDYLQRTARWRADKPRFTDKLPENWKHAGILRAMLPGAKTSQTICDSLVKPISTP